MMERIRYDFTTESCLNFGKEKRTLLCSFVPKGKDPDYYHRPEGDSIIYLRQSRQILNLKKKVDHDCSSIASSWDSDVSIHDIFGSLSVNMVSTSHVGDEEDTFGSEELIQSDSDT